jgi:hypothetical protein
LRLTGKEAEAKTYTNGTHFNDSYLVAFEEGRNMLSYLRNHPEYGWQGDQNGNMDPNGLVTPQAIYKVSLTVLGYRSGIDFKWEETLSFAEGIGLTILTNRRMNLTNNDLAYVLVETLKATPKDKTKTLCEVLIDQGVIDRQLARSVSMIPDSTRNELLPYHEGGPLIAEVTADISQNRLSITFNTGINPSYAKALSNYSYFVFGGRGYVPLPSTCKTSMQGEFTVIIQFPERGWSEGNVPPREAFTTFIATFGANEIKISGLMDVDGNILEDIYVDVPR